MDDRERIVYVFILLPSLEHSFIYPRLTTYVIPYLQLMFDFAEAGPHRAVCQRISVHFGNHRKRTHEVAEFIVRNVVLVVAFLSNFANERIVVLLANQTMNGITSRMRTILPFGVTAQLNCKCLVTTWGIMWHSTENRLEKNNLRWRETSVHHCFHRLASTDALTSVEMIKTSVNREFLYHIFLSLTDLRPLLVCIYIPRVLGYQSSV